MRNVFIVLSYCLLYSFPACSQLFPADSSVLNYRIIGFTFPSDPKANNYKLEIESGKKSGGEFGKSIITAVNGKSNRIIAEVPTFGSSYCWRVIAYKNSKIVSTGPVHYFSTGTSNFLDTARHRMEITHQAEKFKDAYIFTDATRALYNMKGQPVWYLPPLEGVQRDNAAVRDLKLSCKGTITFLLEGDIFEVNYNGKILWRGPSGRKIKSDTLQGYHHEMTRLSNGHYMSLGFEPVLKRTMSVNRDSIMRAMRSDTSKAQSLRTSMRKPRYGNLLEYDEAGNEVWSWEAAKYFTSIDLTPYKNYNGGAQSDVHENSFYFDEPNKVIYVGFRNLSQVLKISYPSGKVLKAYGSIDQSPNGSFNNLFCGQHACKASDNGYLYLFNNGCDISELPEVIKLREPVTAKDTLAKIWSFTCPAENTNLKLPHERKQLTSGGNVVELPDQSLLVSTCSPYSSIFIVSKDKEILWHASIEKMNPAGNLWQPSPLYRASIIQDSEQLENLIWNGIEK